MREEAILTHPAPQVIDLDGLHVLVGVLRDRGYCVVGPTRREGAIVYEEIASADELPAGWTEVQEAATYRLERREDEARFGYPVGPHSWKRWLLPARMRLWQAHRDDGGRTEFVEEAPPSGPLRCSVFVRAISTRSRFRTGSSSRARTSIATTRRAAKVRSSSPSTAVSRAGRASALRWERARGQRAVSTSRSPSWSVPSTGSSSRWAPIEGPRCWRI